MSSAASIEILVQKLMTAFKEELSVIRVLDEEAQQLHITLVMIQGYLNYVQKDCFMIQEAVNTWLKELEEMAFNADSVLDEITYHLLHNKLHKMKAPMDKDKVLSFLNHISRPQNMAPRIKQINKDFDSMNQRAARSGLQSVAVNAPTAASFNIDSFTCDSIFTGRDDDVLKLVYKLIQIPQEETFSILTIVGSNGVGKTTLTRNVFNHENIKAQFGSRIWVHVSQSFDPLMVFKSILSTLTLESTDGIETEETILKKLQQAFKAKTYLLVLDDVWNGDILKWKKIINSISEVTSTRGNAIIITSNDREVAPSLNSLIHPLNVLSDEDCWYIIKAKTFGKGEVPSRFEIVGTKIARICQGLPLNANIVGGLLRGQDWMSVEQKWFPYVGRDEIRSNYLKFVLDSLSPPSLKKCITYCSIFPKGYKFVKQELIELWMAEGFLLHDQRNDMESVGNNLFNVLLHNSLLVVAERDNHGNVESCVMPYLVHDHVSSVRVSPEDTNQVRYLFHGDGDGDLNGRETAKYLRTLIFQGEITDTAIFSGFKSLHVLILACDKLTKLSSSISELIYLRNLNISRTRIESLPDQISELHRLQTLHALTRSLRELPSTFKDLISLRHLYIQSDVDLPSEIGRLTNLQALNFRVGEQKGYKIEELGSLDNLKRLSIENLEKVPDGEDAKKAKLSEKQNLISLELEWGENGQGERTNELPKENKERKDKAVLEALEPQPDLERLKIAGFKGKIFPSWTQKMAVDEEFSIRLDRLTEITLSSCQECEEIPSLGHLPNLKTLSLRRLSNVRLINSSFYGTGNGIRVIFPALESMLLLNMAELSEWTQIEFANEVKVFPRLQSLKMYHCYKLECLPNWLFCNTHCLSELDIRHCPKLRELPDGLHALNSLEQITIRGCRNLKSIVTPSSERSLTSLRSLEICDCQELTKVVEPSAPWLKKVSVVELKSLENLHGFLDCLAASPLLEQLSIVGVPKSMSTSSVESWPFKRLQKLEIDVNKETSQAIRLTVDGILRNCRTSLGELTLTGLEMWKSLPDSIRHLTALYSLELEDFGGETLPEWFGNLSSLTSLCLSDCTNLRCLPSLQSFIDLQELHIRDCPGLRIESERHKILNRTLIYINGHQL
ncbi:putative disease resistance protein RGA4 [Salvia hispanica]|uniref:putative disease resistance protein RGA4 n=1 Tax=Salvia hispanica TaxID=49212 RepID=UPI0020090799|nr:putative disease resistance protein RGA4 [Salvia hispanica]XP_047945043.1 putative disease resistance protein RGA4 [Salvia hispanica]XP_047945044.1 putative disease resistance protein RGA4 [Salvia hispanica]